MPIPMISLLIFLFFIGVVFLIGVVLLIASAISGTMFLKRKGKDEALQDTEQ